MLKFLVGNPLQHVKALKTGRPYVQYLPCHTWPKNHMIRKSKGSVGEGNCLKTEKTPDTPGLKPGTLLVMSNALTTELWDQAESRRH